jgi:SAM-dependent methyltransferase
VKNPYDRNFFESKIGFSDYTAEVFYNIIKDKLPKFDSVVDIGCGTGNWLSNFESFGSRKILGIDNFVNDSALLEIKKDQYLKHDLTQALELNERFDLALCLEVGEHLPKTSSEILIQSLTSLSDYVVFSAAIPGQGGCNHVNEQWQSFWINLFKEYNFSCYDFFRPSIWMDEKIPFWFKQNSFLFVNNHTQHDFSNYSGPQNFQNLVHPELFSHVSELRNMTLRKNFISRFFNRFL